MSKFLSLDIILYLSLVALGSGGFLFALIWPQTEGFYAFVVAVALAGLGVASYIWYGKRYRKHLACPSGDDCNKVVTSKYAAFLSIPLEYLGILYYTVVAFSYSAFLLFGVGMGQALSAVLILTALAFLFSLYLTCVQGFILKKWCIWCLLSAALSSIIFVASLVSIEAAGPFIVSISSALEFTSSLGFVLGMGGATAGLFIFLKCLRDFTIDDHEGRAIKGVSELVWLGFMLILISEYTRYVANSHELAFSGIFTATIIALSVVFVSGATLSVLFAPFLEVLPFAKNNNGVRPSSLEGLRRATLVTGAISISSWYFAFTLGYLPEYPLATLLTAYAVVLAGSVIVSLVWEGHINRH